VLKDGDVLLDAEITCPRGGNCKITVLEQHEVITNNDHKETLYLYDDGTYHLVSSVSPFIVTGKGNGFKKLFIMGTSLGNVNYVTNIFFSSNFRDICNEIQAMFHKLPYRLYIEQGKQRVGGLFKYKAKPIYTGGGLFGVYTRAYFADDYTFKLSINIEKIEKPVVFKNDFVKVQYNKGCKIFIEEGTKWTY
jgi:hypothetical protein